MRKRGNQPKIEKVVQYVDDQKNSSVLAKIHEMSITTKQRGKVLPNITMSVSGAQSLIKIRIKINKQMIPLIVEGNTLQQ